MILIAILIWWMSLFVIFDKHLFIKNKTLKFCLSFLIAISILSYSYSISLFSGLNFIAFQILFLITPTLILLKNRIYFKSILRKAKTKLNTNLKTKEVIIILSCFILFTSMFFFHSYRWGKWDAWAIWSLHAKFLISGDHFSNLFTNDIGWTHPDYPLMLSSIIASIWKSLENTSAFVPIFIAYITCILLMLFPTASIFEIKNKKIAIISLMIISSSILLFQYGSYQYSDTLLSLFIITSIILTNHLKKEKSILLLLLIGFISASCGWIKNEGVIFFAIFIILFILSYKKENGNLKFLIAGTLIPISVIIIFKLNYAPTNDMVNETSLNSFSKLIDGNRYLTVIDFIKINIIYKNPLLYILLISSIALDYKYCFSLPFKILVSLFIIYFFVYILTPKDLDWHLKTSIERLFHHISPALLYSMFFYFGKKYKLIFEPIKV